MSATDQHPASWCVPALKDFAEGRTAPDHWFAWWEQHRKRLQADLPPAWFLRLQPGGHTKFPSDKAVQAVSAVSYVLTALQVPHTPTNRYKIARNAEHAAYALEAGRHQADQQAPLQLVVGLLKPHFPIFAALLKQQDEQAIELAAAATEAQLQELDERLGIQLPGQLKLLLKCSSRIELAGLCLGNLFIHETQSGIPGPSTGMLCIADYFLEADGDQVLIDPRELPADDPPVYYYAHDIPEVRPLADRFSGWLESLRRSPLFCD